MFSGTKMRRRSPEPETGLLHDLNDVVIWSDRDAEIDRIMQVIYWLEVELREEKEKLGVDKTN